MQILLIFLFRYFFRQKDQHKGLELKNFVDARNGLSVVNVTVQMPEYVKPLTNATITFVYQISVKFNYCRKFLLSSLMSTL